MEVYILDPEYNPIGVIDEAESVLWNPKYNDIGECEIYIPCSEEYLSLLHRGNYIYRFDDDMFCKIETTEIETSVENGDYIIATAKDICNILAGRIVRWNIAFSGTLGNFIKKVLDDNVIGSATRRAISHFVYDTSNLAEFDEEVEVSAFTDDLLQLIITTCKTHSIGFRVSFDMETRKLVFRLYRGKNKASIEGEEYVEFSPQFANILSSHYKEDDSNYKNVVYVGYKSADKDDDTVYLYSYPLDEVNIIGEARREMYVNGTGTSRDITYDELVQMFGDVSKESKTISQENPEKEVISSVYYATVSGGKTAVATSLQDKVETGAEPAEEKITVTNFTYMRLIRRLAQDALAERKTTQSFEGEVDIVSSYAYKVDYNIGDIVKVINEYGIEAAARITEVMESDDVDNGFSVEPKFEYLN
jgi:hypothetical protein